MNSRLVRILVVVSAGIIALAIVQTRHPAPMPAPTPALTPTEDIEMVPPATTQGLPQLVCLGAGKCVPCKAMEPIREELKREYPSRLSVVFHDVWKNPDVGEQYGVRIIPTSIFYDAAGRELARVEGFISKKDILARFAQLGVNTESQP